MAGYLGPGYVLVSVVSALGCAGLAYWVHDRRDGTGVETFVVGLALASLWSLLTGVHVATGNWLVMATIAQLDLGFGLAGATILLVFILQFTDNEYYERRWVRFLLAAPLAAYVLLPLTGAFQPLVVRETVAHPEPFAFVEIIRGPVHFAFLGVVYAYLLVVFHLLVKHVLSARPGTRLRIAIITAGATLVAGLNVLSVLRYVPVPGFDHAALGLLPYMLSSTVAIFKHDFLHVEPVARNKLIEHMSDPVLVVDGTGLLTDYNRAGQELFGDGRDHIGEPLSNALPNIAEALRFPDNEAVLEEQLTIDDGRERRHYSTLVSPLARGGGDTVHLYAVLLRDVTELEQSRRELREKNERLDQFASTVSHDLRNPLTVVDGRTELLQRELDSAAEPPADGSPDRDRLREHVAHIGDASNRMDAIIDDLLTLAREGESVADPDPIQFSAVANEAWQLSETADGTLTIETPGLIVADRSRLTTVLENLFRNAADHGPDDVAVTAGVTEDGFYLEDDGPGIEDGAAVFEFGYTSSDDGTGLGLSIVTEMVDAHGWDIHLDEEYDDGARFVVTGATTAVGADEPPQQWEHGQAR